MKRGLVILPVLLAVIAFSITADARGTKLVKDTGIQVGRNFLTFKGGTPIEMYSNSTVKSGQLLGDLNYNYMNSKIIFSGAPAYIYFHENGRVRMGTIKKNTRIPTKEGLIWAMKNTGVAFHSNSHIRLIIAANTTRIKGAYFQRNMQLYFHKKNGKFHYGTLSRDAKVNGITFKKGTKLYFHNNGKLAKGTVAKSKTVKKGLLKKKKLKAGKTYSFDRKGKLK